MSGMIPTPYARQTPYNNDDYTMRMIDLMARRSAASERAELARGAATANNWRTFGDIAMQGLSEIAKSKDAARVFALQQQKMAEEREQQRLDNEYRDKTLAAAAEERRQAQAWRERQDRNQGAIEAADNMRPNLAVSPEFYEANLAGTPAASRFAYNPAMEARLPARSTTEGMLTPGYAAPRPDGTPDTETQEFAEPMGRTISPDIAPRPEAYRRMPNFAEQNAADTLESQRQARIAAQQNTDADNRRQDTAAQATAAYRASQLALAGRRVAATERNADASQAPTEVAPPLDPTSQDLMGQAGLSYNGFLALTGKMASLPRDRVTRARASQEVADWARKRGVDVSTFGSQYKAYNETLEKNIERQNNIISVQDELVGDVASVRTAAEALGFDNVRAANAAQAWLKGELNDPAAADYAFALQALTNDLARYNAASTGRAPLESDMADARATVMRGVSSGGLTGLEASLTRSVANMNTVMDSAVDRSRANVWKLFGVGDKYTPKVKPTAKTPAVPDMSGVKEGEKLRFRSGPFAGQEWTVSQGQPKRWK